jgi:hypothetical protein
METWRNTDMQTCRHEYADIDMQTSTWRNQHGDMEMETWTCRHDMETWTCRHRIKILGNSDVSGEKISLL